MRTDWSRRDLRRFGAIPAVVIVGLCLPAYSAEPIDRGDSAWASRADGERQGRPLAGPIGDAIRAYGDALSARPEDLEARWKLLRALHFEGEFASSDDASARRSLDRAVEIAERGLDLLGDEAASGNRLDETDLEAIRIQITAAGLPSRDVARLYFWSAICWGAWSRGAGLLSAVGEGVANRMHRYTGIAIALEPDYDEGGGFRLLGRLHAALPRVPFVTGWVDREKAIPELERAYAIAPTNPGNRLLLALTLLDLAPERRGEALDLLRQVATLQPRPMMTIEDLAMRETARERLASQSPEEAM